MSEIPHERDPMSDSIEPTVTTEPVVDEAPRYLVGVRLREPGLAEDYHTPATDLHVRASGAGGSGAAAAPGERCAAPDATSPSSSGAACTVASSAAPPPARRPTGASGAPERSEASRPRSGWPAADPSP